MSEQTTQADEWDESDERFLEALAPRKPAQSEPLTDEGRDDDYGVHRATRVDREDSYWWRPEYRAQESDEWQQLPNLFAGRLKADAELAAWAAQKALRQTAPSEALEGLIEKHPLDALLAIADRLLAEFYPESVFPDVPDEPADGDSGPQLIRAVRRARADLARDAVEAADG